MRCSSSTTPPRRHNPNASTPPSTTSCSHNGAPAPPSASTAATSKTGEILEEEDKGTIAGVQGKGQQQRDERGCGGGEDRRRAVGKEGGRDRGSNVVDEEFRPRRRFKVSGTIFEVDAKYELIKPIGHGAYGVVISALNTETGQKVAIKKITRAFDDLVDAKRILREITLLRKFDHENIISIVDILVPPSPEEFEDVYIVSDLMETDLHRIINSEQDLSLDHVQYFLYQVLRALKYMHSSNVLHRDLKPSNLLLNSNCDLKVCDLGLARDIESGCTELTEYVVTRWYRAPEIMLACQEYTKAIDIWSVGCIFAELMLRRPYFPGDNYIDQLTMICDKLGKPGEDELTFVSTDKARRFIIKLSDNSPPCLRDQFPATASDEALDLLSKLLEFNPDKRISVEDALGHPFMKNLHAAKEEPTAKSEFCFGFEAEEPRKHRLQELMWDEMRRFHPEQGPWKGKTGAPVKGKETGSIARTYSHLGREDRPSKTAETKQPPTAPLGRSPIITSASRQAPTAPLGRSPITASTSHITPTVPFGRSPITASTSGDGANVADSSTAPISAISNGDANLSGNASNSRVPREGDAEQAPPSAPQPEEASNTTAICPSDSSPAAVAAAADRTAPTTSAVATVFPASSTAAAAVPSSAVDKPKNAIAKGHGRSTSTSDQTVAAAPVDSASASAPEIYRSIPHASSPSSLSSKTEPIGNATTTAKGARTRATTRERGDHDQTPALPLSHGRSSTVGGGIEASSAGTEAVSAGVAGVAAAAAAAAAVEAAVATGAAAATLGKRSMPTETDPNKRQRVRLAAQAARRETTMVGGDVDAMACASPAVQGVPTARKAVYSAAVVSKETFQGAPADGTSEFLSQAGAGHETPDEAPSSLGKRKIESGDSDAAGVVVKRPCPTGSGTT